MTNSSTVIGAGAWGTALATVLSHNAEIVKLFGRDEKAIQAIESTRINERYLPGIRLPNNIQAVDDISKSQHHGLLVLAIPFQSIRTVLSLSLIHI